jgi:hypothetical protein
MSFVSSRIVARIERAVTPLHQRSSNIRAAAARP